MTSFQNTIHSYRPGRTAPQRLAGFMVAVALNGAAAYALLAGLGMVPMPMIPMPINGRVIVEPRTVELPPPPQPVIPQPRIVEIVPPTIEVPLEPADGRNIITVPEAPLPQPSVRERLVSVEPSAPPPVIFTPARAIAASHTIPDYPPVSRRLGEQGTLHLRLAIGADGAVEDARVETSSGYKRLDEAAVQWVRSHWRYEPAKQGSRAVASSASAVVTFALK